MTMESGPSLSVLGERVSILLSVPIFLAEVGLRLLFSAVVVSTGGSGLEVVMGLPETIFAQSASTSTVEFAVLARGFFSTFLKCD